ncbi:hypothetical protein HPSAT_07455 [Helicobacter pylori Sat464]|nr:hypothetical protein HPSAT_07455 [Helicobacter pylori Sat464]
MQQALQDKSISPCLVDDYRYLNKGIPNFFDYNIKDKNEAKERQDEKEKLADKIEKDEKDSKDLRNSEIDTKDTTMSEAPFRFLACSTKITQKKLKYFCSRDRKSQL